MTDEPEVGDRISDADLRHWFLARVVSHYTSDCQPGTALTYFSTKKIEYTYSTYPRSFFHRSVADPDGGQRAPNLSIHLG